MNIPLSVAEPERVSERSGRIPALWLLLFAAAPVLSAQTPVPDQTLSAGGAQITVSIAPDVTQKPADILHWVQRATDAMVAYYGRFPVPAVHVSVRPSVGEPVNSGHEHQGRHIAIGLDPKATARDLRHDWMLTHEMFHLGFPSLNPRYHYLEEGLSDYLEPLARARIHQVSEQRVWRDFLEGMPNGLPKPADSGLDGTEDWGRTYWGGCMFWLLADMDIRQRTRGAKSLDDAILAIVAAGGTGGSDWPLEKVLQTGDAATGTDSLHKVHQLLGVERYAPPLNKLWERLGVREAGEGRIFFDNTAPLASARQAMTARKHR